MPSSAVVQKSKAFFSQRATRHEMRSDQ